MEVLTVLFWTLIGSVFSLIGGVLLLGAAKLRKKVVRYALPFGAGALLGGAFLSVLPEAIEAGDPHQILLYALGGFLGFFILERGLSWFHHHHHHDNEGAEDRRHVWLVIIGDTLHNAIDGVAIGAAFLVNPAAGIATALAVAAHEIPQEIGDFGIMLGKGMKGRSVLLVNVISALATVVTAMTVYLIGDASGINPAPLLAIAAGFFIYIAASDIIPDIHERPRREGNIQALMLIIGVVVIGTVTSLVPHSHEHGETHGDSHEKVGCISREAANAIGAPAPGTSLPPICDEHDEAHDHHEDEADHDHEH